MSDADMPARNPSEGTTIGCHPWYADGTPSAVYAIIQRYRREATDDREPGARAGLLYEIGRLFEEHLGDTRQAEAHYREALSAVANHVPSLRALRRQALERRAYGQALDLLDREIAVTRDAKSLAALRRERALLLEHRLGRSEEARTELVQAHALDPDDGMTLRALVHAARRARDWPALRDALRDEEERASSPEPKRAVRLELARLEETTFDRPDEAEVWYRKMLEADANDADAREGLRRVYRRNGKWRELLHLLVEDAARAEGERRADRLYEAARVALDHLHDSARARAALEELRTIQPDRPIALRELLAIYEASGQWEEAAITARALAGLSSDPREKLLLLHRLGLILHERLDRPDEAILALRVALALDPVSAPILQALGEILVRHGRWQDLCGMHLAEAEAQDDPDRKAMALCRAAEVCERHLQKPEDAVVHYEEALAVRPGFPPALRALELLYRRAGLARDLAELYRRLAENASEPTLKVGYLERRAATLENVVGDVEAAVEAYEAILELEPQHAAAGAALMRIHEERRDWEQLLALLQRLAERDRNEESAAALLLRAGELAERELGDAARALSLYESALALRPTLLPGLQAVGRILHRDGRWEDLVALYRRELDQTENPAMRAATLCRIGGLCEEKLGDPERARQAYHDAFLADPACAPALQALLRLHHDRKDLEGVITVLEAEAAASRDRRRRAAVLCRIGEIWEDPLGKPELALDAFTQALELDPSLRVARHARARLLAERGAWEALAELQMERAPTLTDPDEAFRAWAELGFLLADKVGDLPRAAECLRRALEKRPDDVATLRALAAVQAALSDGERLADTLDRLARRLPADAVRLGHLRERLVEAERVGLPVAEQARRLDELRERAPRDPELALLREGPALAEADGRALVETLEAELPPDSADPAVRAAALCRLADWLARTGRAAEAVDRARLAVDLDPTSLPAVSLWTSLVEATGGTIGPEHLQRLAEASRDRTARCAYLVRAAEQMAEQPGTEAWDRARELLGQALRVDPASVETLGALVRIYGARGEWERLAEELGRIADEGGDRPESVEVLYLLATVQRDRLDDRPAAVRTLNRVLRLQPRHAAALADLGDLYAESDQTNEAIAVYRQLLNAEGEETTVAQAAVHLSVLLEDRLQDTAAAREVLEQARARFPRAPAVLERLVVHLRREGRWREAREIVEQLVARDDLAASRTGYRLLLAELLLEGYADEAEAVAVLRTAAAEEVGSRRAVSRLVHLWSERGRWAEVAGLLEEQVAQAGDRLDRSHAPLLLELAKVRALHLRDLPGAIAAQERAVQLDPDNRAARLRLAELELQSGNTRQALAQARRVLAEDPLERKAHRILFEARETAPRIAMAAAQALRCLGDEDVAVETMLARRRPRGPNDLAGLTLPSAMLRSLLPPAAVHPAGEVLAVVAPVVGVLFATELEVHGATKRDRVGGRGSSVGGLAAVVEAVARAVGLEEVPVYLATVDPARGAFVEPEARPVVVLPRELGEASSVEQIFQIGRAMAKIALGLHLLDKLGAAGLSTLLGALLRIVGAPDRERSSDSAEGRLLELARRLDRDLPRRTRRTLEPLAAALAERPLDRPEAFVAGVELYADRVGLVLSDALVLAVRNAARRDAPETAGSDDLREALRLSPAARDLVRFFVSEEREAIGL